MYKVFAVCALLAAVSAAPADHQATSFASFNDNHNSVHHIQSAPAASHYAAPAPAHYAAPAPAHYAAPAPAHYAAPAPAHYAAPAPAHYAAPAYAAKVVVAAPTPSYYSAPAPVAKLALPVVAKQVIAAPVAKYASAPAYAQKEEEYGPAKYEFAYAIQDPHTGDYHSQEEHRDGHHVVGQYSLHEADGTVRIVKYSDEGHGFNAVVERQGHPTEAPAAYKKVVAVAAPQYAHHY